MKKLKLFFALFAMLALGVGNAWAEEVTETIMMKGFGGKTNNAYQNVTVSGTSDAGTAMVAYAYNGSNGQVRGNKTIVAGASVTSEDKNKNWSLYNSEAMGGSIKSITVTQTATGVNKFQNNLYVSLGTSSQGDVTAIKNAQKQDAGGTANEINFTIDASNGYTYFKLLSTEKFVSNSIAGVVVTVTYETASSGGGDEPVASLSADPTTIDFGTVYQGATVTDQTIAVNFENLTGNVTYSGLSTPFSATGNISTTGDKITISADASTIGEYSQTLTVASTADSKTAEVIVKMNVVAKPAPTGTFTLHTGELIEGDYVIYYSGKAMKAEVASNRLQYVEVTPSNDEIVDPAAAAIWHIAKSGDNWTIYNNNKGYAAGTGTKSQAGLVTNLTGDNANKAAWTVTASGNAYEFVNVWNKSKSVNANLRNNTTYGFACYATGTGGALSLYRKAGTKYNVTVNSTTNGSVTVNPTSAEAGTTIALTVTPDAGYVLDALTVTDASSNTVTVTNNEFTMPAADVTIAATFKENEKPAATLTLSKNGVTEDITGYKQDDKVILPSITSDCVKEFVGWSADANCTTEPEYAAGDSYTLTATAQTLYAVYAKVEGGEISTTDNLFNKTNGSFNSTAGTIAWSLDGVVSILQEKSNASSPVADYVDAPRWYKDHLITITPSANITEIAVKAQSNDYAKALANSTYNNATATINGDIVTITPSSANEVVTIKMGAQARLNTLTVTYAATASYSNYSTTCAAAPIATVDPTSVTATVAGGNGKVEVTYENVNTENVSVALYNDAACTETFTASWLTAALDGDKNVTYTVAENTTYAERKAYIKLTAPETTGATDPAVVVIPVTQAAKDKVFASLEELVAADLTAGDEVTVTLNNDVIKEFYIYSSKRCGVVFDVQKDGKDIKIYFNNQTTIVDWAVGGKLSGTLTNVKWTTYSSAWQLAPANTWAWANLTYTEPKAVSTVVVSGAPTKTTYVDGEAFDPAGLTVTVNYNDATNEVNPTGVTFAVTPATLVKGQTSVSVTATFNSVSSAAYEVTGLTVNDIPTKTVAEFIAAGGTRCYLEGIVSGLTEGNSMKYGNFDLTDDSGTIYVYGCLNAVGESKKFAELGVKNGDKIKVIADEYKLFEGTKQEAIDVQYVSHISAATITIADITMEVGETKTIAATITPDAAKTEVTYSIKENAADAISLSGNTITALAEGTATITATVAEGATYMGNSVDFTVTVKEYVAPISGIWELVTDASTLKAGDKVIIAQYVETDGAIYTMGGQKTNNRDVVESTVSGTTLTPTTGTTVLTLVDAGNGTFALQVDNGKYLYAASSSDNYLKETATINDNAKWAISVTDGKASIVAKGTNTRNIIRYNSNSTLFSCYASGQQDIALYKKMPDYTRDVRQGYYGTICLPNGGVMVGASIFEIAYKDASKIYFDEILSNEMVAGTPYIFLPIDGVDQIEVYYTNEANAPAGRKNGLVGSYTQKLLEADGNDYILLNNQYCEVIGEAYVGANRAYFQLGSIRPSAFAPAPGVRRVSMGMAGQNTATGVDQVQGDNVPTKMIINGQLFILRGEKMYDAQGKLVK
ncbi:MAG: BACON domain-containing carbohydrate-binding protein [Paludibacteraceae bacterium]|nr:BACON domain-containing carbohydrate-binding protein [Paludibacteraceae bacterium]